MLKKIELLADTEDIWTGETVPVTVGVWAWVDGAFAIHKGIGRDLQSPSRWVLSHVATSGYCGSSKSKDGIVEQMHRLRGFSFGGKPIDEIKACDIIEFRNEIVRENGCISALGADEYTATVKPAFEKALGCTHE